MQPDVNILHHAHGFAVYYLTPRSQVFQAQLRATRKEWPAIDELVRLCQRERLAVSFSQAPGIVWN